MPQILRSPLLILELPVDKLPLSDIDNIQQVTALLSPIDSVPYYSILPNQLLHLIFPHSCGTLINPVRSSYGQRMIPGEALSQQFALRDMDCLSSLSFNSWINLMLV